MADGGLIIAPPGWFTDPIGRSELRWWSGAEWTEYVAASPEMLPPDAVLPAHQPLSHLADTSASVPLPGSFVAAQPESAAYVPFGDRTASTADSGTFQPWTPSAPSRWNTGGAWALSATPLVGVATGIGIAFAVTVSPWLALSMVLLPLFWMIAAATRDRAALDEYGYGRVPSRWWLLLGPLGYLVARTIHVRRRSGHGSAPLWWYLGISVSLSVVLVTARLMIAALLPTA